MEYSGRLSAKLDPALKLHHKLSMVFTHNQLKHSFLLVMHPEMLFDISFDMLFDMGPWVKPSDLHLVKQHLGRPHGACHSTGPRRLGRG